MIDVRRDRGAPEAAEISAHHRVFPSKDRRHAMLSHMRVKVAMPKQDGGAGSSIAHSQDCLRQFNHFELEAMKHEGKIICVLLKFLPPVGDDTRSRRRQIRCGERAAGLEPIPAVRQQRDIAVDACRHI